MSNNETTAAKLLDENLFGQSPEGLVLVGSKCESCGKISFPKKYVCPDCFGNKLKVVPLSKKGTLHTFALSVISLPDMEKPYVIGFIDLPEKIKLFSLITDCDPWDKTLKVGMEMEMIIRKIKKDESGNDIWGYKFRPVQGR